jgi:hypothetical protein
MLPGMGKRTILGLVAGALMTLGVAAPAFAAPPTSDTHDVAVTASNQAALVFTIVGTNSVGFPALDPATPCATASNAISFNVKSNKSYAGTVKAATTASNTSGIPVTQLHWSFATADCTSTAFTGNATADTWFGSRPATNSDSFSNSYALDVLYTNNPGAVDMTLTYSVSQL